MTLTDTPSSPQFRRLPVSEPDRPPSALIEAALKQVLRLTLLVLWPLSGWVFVFKVLVAGSSAADRLWLGVLGVAAMFAVAVVALLAVVILDLRADKRSAQCAALCFALLIMALPYVAASMLLGH